MFQQLYDIRRETCETQGSLNEYEECVGMLGTGGTSEDESDWETTHQQPYRGRLVCRVKCLACRAAWITALMRHIDKQYAERLPGLHRGNHFRERDWQEQSGQVDRKIKSGLLENFYDEGWLKKLTKVQWDSLDIQLAYHPEWVKKWEEAA